MHISQRGRDLIKSFESLRLKAYKCPAGIWTIGYGCTSDVKEGMAITATEAEKRLTKDFEPVEYVIKCTLKVPLNQNQFDALASFIFNVGPMAFVKSTLKRCLDAGNYTAAADQFLRWNKATDSEGKRVALKGLTVRRSKERDLFLSKDGI